MLQIGHELLRQPLVIRCLLEILEAPRQYFKDRSNLGGVWLDGRSQDLGNYSYNVLFQIMLFCVKEPGKHPLALERLNRLASMYESLEDKAEPSTLSLEMKVVTCMVWADKS